MRSAAKMGLVTLVLVQGCDDENVMEYEADEHRAIPNVEYCEPARPSDDARAETEARVLAQIERHRAAGFDCGHYGRFAPVQSLHEEGTLRCAARVHAWDMATRSFIAHENPDGERAADRVARVGGRFASLTEAIAAGDIEPERVVDEIWMRSPASCAALMGDAFRDVGVGVYRDAALPGGAWWTVLLAL